MNKDFSSKRRLFWSKKFWESVSLHDLEKKYGKYMYLPLDVPKIVPDNVDEFVDFYFKNAKQLGKLKTDASSDTYIIPTYLSIDSAPTRSYALPENIIYVPEFNERFSSITEQILEYLPFKNVTFKMWSSFGNQYWHRDISCMADLPSQFRIMLYDSNPKPTLFVKRDVPDIINNETGIRLHRLSDTNTFVWNNLRTVHSSEYISGHNKILLIINEIDSEIDWKKFELLMDRSISKYKDYLYEDNVYSASDYLHL